MKATSIVAGIVVIAALGVGGWYLFGRSTETGETDTSSTSPSSSTPTTTTSSCLPASQLPSSLTIKYENNQFVAEDADAVADSSNAVFCVKKGATVTFTGSNLWVASAPHPTHTDLSGFDAKAAMSSYSFTFSQVGTWGFHNHLRASDTGTIIVVE